MGVTLKASWKASKELKEKGVVQWSAYGGNTKTILKKHPRKIKKRKSRKGVAQCDAQGVTSTMF